MIHSIALQQASIVWQQHLSGFCPTALIPWPKCLSGSLLVVSVRRLWSLTKALTIRYSYKYGYGYTHEILALIYYMSHSGVVSGCVERVIPVHPRLTQVL